MKFLVLGASGMAGSLVSLYLAEAGHQVLGVARRKVGFVPSVSMDARSTGRLQELIRAGKFDAVVNAVGVLKQCAEADKEAAVFLNGYLPHFLAKITEHTGTQVIHMSTDCVFSGKAGGYTESSCRDGATFYDRSKAIGELDDCKNLTLRNSIVGPDMDEGGIGLLNWFMAQGGTVRGFTRAMWNGLTTLELAKVMEAAAREKAHGLVNMVPEVPISKYGLLALFNRYLRNGQIKIEPYDGFVVDKTLVRTNFDFAYEIPDYEKMVAELAGWMKGHRQYYRHYRL